MLSATCPKCGWTISLDETARIAKLRCGRCGSVFVSTAEGVTEAAPEPPPVAAIAEEAAAAPLVAEESAELDELVSVAGTPAPISPRRRTRASPWVPVMLLCGLLAVGATACGLWYYRTYPYQEVRDRTGRVLYRGRDQERADQIRGRLRQASGRQRPTAAADAAGRGVAAPGDVAGGEAGPASARLDGDENISVAPERRVVPAGPEGSGYVTGTVVNAYRHGLKSVEVVVALYDAVGRRLAEPGVTLRWIPAGATMPFSVHFEKVKTDRIDSIEGAGMSPVRIDPRDVCLEIDPLVCRKRVVGNRLVVTGEARNDTEGNLMNVEIFCDFLTREGVFVASVKGNLDEAATLKSNESRGFRVEFDPAGAARQAGDITRFVVRLVGTKLP